MERKPPVCSAWTPAWHEQAKTGRLQGRTPTQSGPSTARARTSIGSWQYGIDPATVRGSAGVKQTVGL